MATSSIASTSRNDGEPPAQRRKLVEADHRPADVLLVSEEGVEYPAHSNTLKLSCETFEAMFESSSPDSDLPRIPLFADSETIEIVLPLAYRNSAAGLRDKPYPVLIKCLRLAHRLGMPMVVDIICLHLEKSAAEHGLELYLLACQLDLPGLEAVCRPAAVQKHNITRPLHHVDAIGTRRVESLHIDRSAQLRELVFKPPSYAYFNRYDKRCPISEDVHFGLHWKLVSLLQNAALQLAAVISEEVLCPAEDSLTLQARRAELRSLMSFIDNRIKSYGMRMGHGCPVYIAGYAWYKKLQDVHDRYRLLILSPKVELP